MNTILECLDEFRVFVFPELPKWILILGSLGFFMYFAATTEMQTSNEMWKHTLAFQMEHSDLVAKSE